MFYCEIYVMFKNTYYEEQLRTTDLIVQNHACRYDTVINKISS